MSGYTVILSAISKVDIICDFLCSSMNDEALPKRDLLLKERICSSRSKFFPLRIDPIEKRCIEINGRVGFPDLSIVKEGSKKTREKVSHSLKVVGAVVVRVSLCLGLS